LGWAAEGTSRGVVVATKAHVDEFGGRSARRRNHDRQGSDPAAVGRDRGEQIHQDRRDGSGRRAAPDLVKRNVAEHVDPVPVGHRRVDTYTEAEVRTLLASIADDRLAHAWELALCGLRRGEIAGLRWADVDFDGKALSLANKRVDAGGRAVENDPKSAMSRRTLPLPDRLMSLLRAAKARQAAERLALGADSGPWGLRREQRGRPPLSPASAVTVLARRVKSAGLRSIKLHAARHTAATAMHLAGVPVAVIAA